MSQAVADSVRHLRVVAVNGCYELAPWAEALAANDICWWRRNPEAKNFAGRKFTANRIDHVELIQTLQTQHCSGVLGLEVAKLLGAKSIVLLGADFHGTHYFGDYTNTLRNVTEDRRKEHANQFAEWGKANKSIRVFNCTPGSKLECFPMARLEDVLCEHGSTSASQSQSAAQHFAQDLSV